MRLLPSALIICLCGLAAVTAHAQDRLVQVPTRGEQTIAYWWMPREGAVATVLLFSGGNGGIGFRDGQPRSNNFLIRSRESFREQGFNVALVGNPSDQRQMDDRWRTSSAHVADVSAIIDSIRQTHNQPIWLVGTSRGTISVTALGLALQTRIAGLALTASVTSVRVPASVPQQALDGLRLPVLVYHQRQDACPITQAHETDWIMRKLTQAPVKRQLIVTGGENPSGDPCEALHWHGFIGMEAQAVQDIAGWIKAPQP